MAQIAASAERSRAVKRASGAVRKPSKYRNVPTEVDGVRYDSKREARRAGELALMQRAGIISDLRRQVSYDLTVNGVHIAKYICDFAYVQNGWPVVEDIKGVETDVFKIKAKLMSACHGIAVQVVR